MNIKIKNRFSGNVIFEHDCEDNSTKLTLKIAFESRADLRGADLRGADLRGADLRGADLCDANLRDADLRDANLRGADLCDANLCGADLRDANLRGADLRDANLRGADLCGADLRDANLCGAYGGNSELACMQVGRYKIVVVLKLKIAWGGCTKKTVEEWLEYSGDGLDEEDKNYLESYTKPFLKMFALSDMKDEK